MQNAKAKDNNNYMCNYYSDNGMRCAVGCLIAPDEYDIGMEGTSVSSLIDNYAASPVDEDTVILCKQLQRIHDDADVIEWRTHLERLASNFKLDTAVLDTL